MSKTKRIGAFVAIAAIVFCSACSTFFPRKPWRTYDEMPFDSKRWRDADEVDRGRMRGDMIDKITGKSRDEVLGILGDPDEKVTRDGTEYLLYNTEHPGRRNYLQTPISFTSDGKARIGM